MCTQSASSVAFDEPASTASCPESESPDSSATDNDESRQVEHRPVEQPGEVDDRRHEREAERHHDERLPEPRPVGDRRQVAVDVLRERQLEHVLAAQAEGQDPDLDRRDHTRRGTARTAACRPRPAGGGARG